MPLIEHRDIDDQTTNETSLTKTQEYAGDYETMIGLDGTHAHIDNPPGYDKRWQITASAEMLDEPITGKGNEDVRYVKDD